MQRKVISNDPLAAVEREAQVLERVCVVPLSGDYLAREVGSVWAAKKRRGSEAKAKRAQARSTT